MTIRQSNLLLWGLCAVLGAAAVTVAVAAVILPLAQTDARRELAPRNNVIGATSIPAADEFVPLFSKTFRPSFAAVGATSTAPPSAANVAPPAQLQLVGTIGLSLAILRGPDGTQALAELGDDVDGAVIVAIRPSELDLKSPDGQITTLRRAPDADLPRPTVPPAELQ